MKIGYADVFVAYTVFEKLIDIIEQLFTKKHIFFPKQMAIACYLVKAVIIIENIKGF